jgi:hypothetical protein
MKWTDKITAEYDEYTLTIEVTQNHCFLEVTSGDTLHWFHTVSKFAFTLDELKDMLVNVVDYHNNVGHWISVSDINLL